jgi:hypothetical protein
VSLVNGKSAFRSCGKSGLPDRLRCAVFSFVQIPIDAGLTCSVSRDSLVANGPALGLR